MRAFRHHRTVLLIALAAAVISSGCNKKIVYSKDRDMEPLSKTFASSSIDDAFKAAKEAVLRLGYRIEREDASQGTLRTGWQSTKASSHYVDLFDHRDYGTVGAYYRIELKISEMAGKTEVEVFAPVRSVIGRMKSSHEEEGKILKKMADLLRKDDFEMSNVGVEE